MEQQTNIVSKARKMADAIKCGAHKPIYAKSLYEIEQQRSGSSITWDDYSQLIAEADALIRQDQEDADIAAMGIKLAKPLAAGVDKLKEIEDTLIPPHTLNRMERVIKGLVNDDMMAQYNQKLAVRSGAITHRDVAFVGCLHRVSVLENGKKNKDLAGTSPFQRITKASIAFGYRQKPFDNRQVRAALIILSAIGFTRELEKAVHSWDNKRANKAGTWLIADSDFWTRIFS